MDLRVNNVKMFDSSLKSTKFVVELITYLIDNSITIWSFTDFKAEEFCYIQMRILTMITLIVGFTFFHFSEIA